MHGLAVIPFEAIFLSFRAKSMPQFRDMLCRRCVTPTAFMRDWDDIDTAEYEAAESIRLGHTFAAYDAFASHSGDGVMGAERPSLAR
jgi:hypothetical protein